MFREKITVWLKKSRKYSKNKLTDLPLFHKLRNMQRTIKAPFYSCWGSFSFKNSTYSNQNDEMHLILQNHINISRGMETKRKNNNWVITERNSQAILKTHKTKTTITIMQ